MRATQATLAGLAMLTASLGAATIEGAALTEAVIILTGAVQASADLALVAVSEAVQNLSLQVQAIVDVVPVLAANVAGEVELALALLVTVLTEFVVAIQALIAILVDLLGGLPPIGDILPGTPGGPILPPLAPGIPSQGIPLPLLPEILENIIELKNQTEHILVPILFDTLNTTADTVRGVRLVLNVSAAASHAGNLTAQVLAQAQAAGSASLQQGVTLVQALSAALSARVTALLQMSSAAMATASAALLASLNATLVDAAAMADASASAAVNATFHALSQVEQLEFSVLAAADAAMAFTVRVVEQVLVVGLQPGAPGAALSALVGTNLTVAAVITFLSYAVAQAAAFYAFMVEVAVEKQVLVTTFLQAVVEA